jgi:hypothetical protein
MISIAPPMILTAILLLINAGALRGTGQPILVFLNVAVALYLLYNSITHVGPPRTPARV